MATSTGQGWAQLRQQARSLETQVRTITLRLPELNLVTHRLTSRPQTESLFHSLSQIASLTTSIPPKPTSEETRLETEIQDILEKVTPTVLSSLYLPR